MRACRTLASALVGFAASPSLKRWAANGGGGFTACCPPQTKVEQALLGLPSGLPTSEGWFRVCAAGSGELSGQPLPGGSSASAAATAASPSGGAGGPFASPQQSTQQQSAGGGAGAGLLRLMPPQPPPTNTCSEYAARLAEALYGCAHNALLFLLLTAPEVGEGEGASLGPMWPQPGELTALQDQCIAVAHALCEQPAADLDTRRCALSGAAAA